MRKWRPPDVSAEDQWTVNQQIVIPYAYRPEFLILAHKLPCQVIKEYVNLTTKFSNIFSDQD